MFIDGEYLFWCTRTNTFFIERDAELAKTIRTTFNPYISANNVNKMVEQYEFEMNLPRGDIWYCPKRKIVFCARSNYSSGMFKAAEAIRVTDEDYFEDWWTNEVLGIVPGNPPSPQTLLSHPESGSLFIEKDRGEAVRILAGPDGVDDVTRVQEFWEIYMDQPGYV